MQDADAGCRMQDAGCRMDEKIAKYVFFLAISIGDGNLEMKQ
jgi:hypothetical protein